MKLIDNIKKKFEKKKELDKLGEPVIKIVTYRFEAETLPVEIGSYLAYQTNNGSTLEYVGNNGKFRRDVNITKNEIQESLIYKLNLNSMSRIEKIELVTKEVKEQEKVLASYDKGYATKKVKIIYTKEQLAEAKLKEIILPVKYEYQKVKVNEIDEKNKLKHYQTLLDEVEFGGDGSYIVMSKGIRVMHLKYEDGLYFPFKWIKGRSNILADNGTKQKHFKSTDVLLKEELADSMAGTGHIQWIRIVQVLSVIFCIIGIAFMFYGYQTQSHYSETVVKESTKIAIEVANKICSVTNQTVTDAVINSTLVQNLTTNI